MARETAIWVGICVAVVGAIGLSTVAHQPSVANAASTRRAPGISATPRTATDAKKVETYGLKDVWQLSRTYNVNGLPEGVASVVSVVGDEPEPAEGSVSFALTKGGSSCVECQRRVATDFDKKPPALECSFRVQRIIAKPDRLMLQSVIREHQRLCG